MRFARPLRFAEFHYLQIKLYSLVGGMMMDGYLWRKEEEEASMVIDIRVSLGVWFEGH